MSPDGAVEILKLARHVDAEPEDLAYLQYVAPQDIRDLREQVAVAIFDADRHMLQRLASATKLIPTKLAAVVAQQALGTLLSARVTGLLEPARAVAIAEHLPTAFLADLAVQLDPRRASRVIAEFPPKQIAEITAELAGREEYIVMGGFVGHLPEAALRAATEVVDDEDLLLTAYVVDAKANLGALVGLLPEERLGSIIRAAHEAELWAEALDVLGHVSEEQRGQLGDLAAAQEDEVLDGMVRTAQTDGLWGDVLPVTRAMSPESRIRFAKLESVQAQEVLEQIIDAAHEHELWSPLVVFATDFGEGTKRQVADLLADAEDEILDGLLGAVGRDGLEDDLAGIASYLPDKDLNRFTKRLGTGKKTAPLRKALEQV